MGKKWDYDVPSIEIWKEALRVLKPGGTALIFAGSRTQHRMAVNVEDAGFILKDCIMWLYGSGFPKATDISKQLDKGVERKVIGNNKNHRSLKDTNCMVGEPHSGDGKITEPATPEAKLWNGWKSHGLKPAYEPILVAVKPNDGTYANNALTWGVSGLNIDGGRIGTKKMINRPAGNKEGGNSLNMSKIGMPQDAKETVSQGRFPANIILDEEAGKMLDEQSGELKSGARKKQPFSKDKNLWNKMGGGDCNASKGGASRFFYCAKASKSERNAGCEELDKKAGGSNAKRYTKDVANGLDRNRPVSNFHPTVKPLKLMEYLCILTKTPTGGVVLDMFAGSGTTGVACKNTDRDFIGIELDPEYIKIAEARINNIKDKQQTLI